jgi:TolB-like protein
MWHDSVMRRLFTAGCALALALVATPALAGKPRVAIKDLDRSGVDENTASLLTSQLCTALSKHDVDVICASDLAALLGQAAIQQQLSSCEGDDCLKALGAAAKAQYVVAGSIGKLDETYVLTVQLVDGKTSKVIARVSEKTDGKVSDLLERIPDIAKKLKP